MKPPGTGGPGPVPGTSRSGLPAGERGGSGILRLDPVGVGFRERPGRAQAAQRLLVLLC